jgi:hypothetical protein
MKTMLWTFLIAVLLGGCAANADVAPAAVAVEAKTGASFGAAMPAEPAAQALAGVDMSTLTGQAVKLSGRIGKVCQVKGCWMMLTDGDATVRVKFGSDDFFIPKDSQGEAVAFGKIVSSEMSLAESKHMAQDAGIDPATITTATVEYQMVATAVVLKQ